MPGPLGRLSFQIAFGPVLVIALAGAAMFWRVDADLHRQAEDRFAERVTLAATQVSERIRSQTQLRLMVRRTLPVNRRWKRRSRRWTPARSCR